MYSDFTLVRSTVDGDDRDLGFIGCKDRVGYCCGVYRIHDEDADVALEQVSDIIGLFCRIILCIDDLDIHASLFSSCFDAVCHGDEEWVVLRGDREADGDFLRAGSRIRVGFLIRAATTSSRGECCANESC